MESQEVELVSMNNQGLSDTTDDIIASADKRQAQMERIVTLSIKRTNVNDWVDQNGKPYLTCSGAEKIARLFGVSWKVLKSEKVISADEKGQFYYFEFTGEFTLGRDRVETIGTCSSKDQFFAKHKVKNQETGEMESTLKPLSEVDETNIRKAAYSNMVSNGITRLLGIRNLTWDQVKAGGIDASKTAKVTYASGGAGGGLISDAQRNRLFAIIKKSGKTEEQLKDYLFENFKIESTKEIGWKEYKTICEWAEGKEIGL